MYASGTSKAPLDERLRLGLLSDAAAMRWQREGRLIGLTVEQLQDAFGIDNVHVRDDSDVALSYESDLLAHIECTMRAGRVESSRVVIP